MSVGPLRHVPTTEVDARHFYERVSGGYVPGRGPRFVLSQASRRSGVVGLRYKQRVTQRIKHGRPTGVYRQLQLLNDRAHPPALCSVGKPEFIELPTMFVIFQPKKQLVDHVVQVYLLSSQTRVISRPLTIRQARRQFDRHVPSVCSRCVPQRRLEVNRDGSRTDGESFVTYGWRLVCRQGRRKLGCERGSVIHERVPAGKSALVAQESSPADLAVASFAGLSVYSSNCDARHPRNDRGGEATRAIAVDGL